MGGGLLDQACVLARGLAETTGKGLYQSSLHFALEQILVPLRPVPQVHTHCDCSSPSVQCPTVNLTCPASECSATSAPLLESSILLAVFTLGLIIGAVLAALVTALSACPDTKLRRGPAPLDVKVRYGGARGGEIVGSL